MADSKTGSEGSVETAPSTKPYLVRAIYEWCVDCGFTPQILVDAAMPEVVVPVQYVQDDRIILNIHPQSVKDLVLGNEYVLFSARFGGKPQAITVPVFAILAVYSRENGQGIVFQDEINQPPPDPGEGEASVDPGVLKPEESSAKRPESKSGAHLKLIK